MGYDESKLSFHRTSLRFYSAFAILETQVYVVVEQFGGAKYLAAQRASYIRNKCKNTRLEEIKYSSVRSHGTLAMIMVNLAKSWLTMVPLSRSWQIMIHGTLVKIMARS